MCTDPSVSQRIFALPGMQHTRTSDNKILTGEERLQSARAIGSAAAGAAPSESDKAVFFGGGKSKGVSKATQTARRQKAAAKTVIPGRTPVMK